VYLQLQKRRRDNILHVVVILLCCQISHLYGVLVLSRVLLIFAVCSIFHPSALFSSFFLLFKFK
jgi:hypothetical protein